MTSVSLWNYYRDELTDETNDDNDQSKNVISSESFKYKKVQKNLKLLCH